MSNAIKCRPWNIVDRIKHKHPRKYDREVREWYINLHSALAEGQKHLCDQPCIMMLEKQGKNFVIQRFDYYIHPTTKQMIGGE